MRRKLVFVLITLFIVATTVGRSLEASVPLDGILDESLLYKRGYACSLADPKSIAFFLLINETGVGYLADMGNFPRNFPCGPEVKRMENGVPGDWIEIMKSFSLNNHRAWTKLNFKTATTIWGQSRKHSLSGRTFYTFDAYGTNGEKNIFHVDLQFDKFDQVSGYRVRGIGICNAKWVIKIGENRITITD